jgi:hypothetical protein
LIFDAVVVVVISSDWSRRIDVVAAVVSIKEMICLHEEQAFIYPDERQMAEDKTGEFRGSARLVSSFLKELKKLWRYSIFKIFTLYVMCPQLKISEELFFLFS